MEHLPETKPFAMLGLLVFLEDDSFPAILAILEDDSFPAILVISAYFQGRMSFFFVFRQGNLGYDGWKRRTTLGRKGHGNFASLASAFAFESWLTQGVVVKNGMKCRNNGSHGNVYVLFYLQGGPSKPQLYS